MSRITLNKRQMKLAEKYSTLEYIRDRLEKAENHKHNIEADYQTAYEYFMEYGNIYGNMLGARIIHSTIADAKHTFINFIMYMLFGVKSPWAKIQEQDNLLRKQGFRDEALANIKKKYREVNMENTNTAFDYMFTSNYYVEVTKAMTEAGILGTGCYKVEETNSDVDPYFFTQKQFYQYYIDQDVFKREFVVFEELDKYTLRELETIYPNIDFSSMRVDDDDESEYKGCNETEYTVYESIIPIYDTEKGTYIFQRSIGVDRFNLLLEQHYMNYNPYVIWRFSVIGGSPWGKGAGVMASYSASKLAWKENKRDRQIGKAIDPAMGGVGDEKYMMKIDFEEGAFNYLGDPMQGKQADVKPITPYQNFIEVDQDIVKHERQIQDMFLAKPFGNFTDQEGAKPKNEIEYRMDMFKQTWSGTAELLDKECMSPTFKIPYLILQDKDLLTDDGNLDLSVNGVKFVNLLSKSTNLDNAQNRLNYTMVMQQMTGGMERFMWDKKKVIYQTADEFDVDQRLLLDSDKMDEAIEQHEQMVAQMMAQEQMKQEQ